MGCCGVVFTVCVSGYGGEFELYVPFSSWFFDCAFSLLSEPVGILLTGIDAPIIMASVTIFALISYFVMPEDRWLPKNRISHFIDTKGEGRVSETVEEIQTAPAAVEGERSREAQTQGQGQGHEEVYASGSRFD